MNQITKIGALLFVTVGLLTSTSNAAPQKIKNFRIRTCSTDLAECYEITSPQVERSSTTSLYSFSKGQVRILSKNKKGYSPRETINGKDGSLDLTEGTLTLKTKKKNKNLVLRQNLRTKDRSIN